MSDWHKLEVKVDNTCKESKTLIDKYIERLKKYEQLSLVEFAKSYTVTNSSYKSNINNKIVIIYPKYKHFNSEDMELYYKQQCILQIPFRSNLQDLVENIENVEQPWFSLFEERHLEDLNSTFMNANEDDINDRLDSVNEDDMDGDGRHLNAFEMVSSTVTEKVDQCLGQRLIDLTYDWSLGGCKFPSFDEVSAFLKSFKNTEIMPLVKEIRDNLTLSSDQLMVLNICRRQIENFNRVNNNDEMYKRIIVQGKAGSGKSTIIHSIVNEIKNAFGENSVALVAPTGAAALNIGGTTIHAYFKIPLFFSKFEPLSGESLRKFQLNNEKLKFVIVDEMSMVGCRLLYQIEKRCRDIFPLRDEPFGGLIVYMFGDFNQLPPVKDAAFYNHNENDVVSTNGAILLQSFQLFIELTTSHRQNNDVLFSNMLERIARGALTVTDFTELFTRRRCVMTLDDIKSFDNVVHLLPTNALVKDTNLSNLRKLGTPVACINAIHTPNVRSIDGDSCGLDAQLYLAIGSRIILRHNVWVAGGLVNGSVGTVKAIVYDENVEPPNLPRYILVKFESYTGPCVIDDLFPIVPIVRSWDCKGVTFSRKQFPISLGYAVTIHKSQGLTLASAVIDIGTKEFCSGLTYVALSRVRSLKNIMFSEFYAKKRFDVIGKSCATKLKIQFIENLKNKLAVH
ncbi:uncharacterized protein LOC111694302 [Trichogramma pretiosum]|uniref:uncharacterized protein LOC111694302 n=1 Tax=Trichogramma pretiosum TaxID=7493 RepID=UPI000C71C813|nr:uncharacterized protein LOC111694302 [Trichogramma pretiosum]